MKILIVSTAVVGHLSPLLSVAKILMKHNHEVVVQTGASLKPMVEASGARFIPFAPEAEITPVGYILSRPERENVTPGLEMICFDVEHFFAEYLPAQAASLRLALRDFPADVILVNALFWGTLPLLLEKRGDRPAIIHVGTSVLNFGSGRNVPPSPDSSPEEQRAERERWERVLLKPAQKFTNAALAKTDCGPLPCPVMESMSILPDLYLHLGISGFEYPDPSPTASPVKYIGLLPPAQEQSVLPDWWHELDKTKKLVLVTQGTVANRDFGQLIGPALTALAGEEDLIVLVTTGNQPIEAIPVKIPTNARVAKFLPFQLILPSIDLLITNGGYGTVNMALAQGVPIVSAGMTEDKAEVSAHVQWAGVGIDLRTNQATPEAIRDAAREILDMRSYRSRARELAEEFASHDTEDELLRLMEDCVKQTSKLNHVA